MEPAGQRRKITRVREFRACVECRHRKLKCDRQAPCSACTRRKDAVSCVYAASLRRPRNGQERRSEAEARLEHLEHLVQELSRPLDQGPIHHPLTYDNDQSSNNNGASGSTNTTTTSPAVVPTYKGATHWSAMLDDVEALRYTLFDQEDLERDIPAEDDHGFGVLFGAVLTMSFQDVLDRFLPPRRDVDQLVALYFRSRAVVAPCLHPAQFDRQYQCFWAEPARASRLWTSILFSILNVATSVLLVPVDQTVTSPSAPYAVAAAHCLAMGGYHQPKPHALDAMLLFAHGSCLTDCDMSPELAILHGSTVRLATLMGYHRDPSTMRSPVSPFHTEMRRRTWSLCMQLDLLICFQLGLPPNVQHPTWDTQPPSNLLTTDFDEPTLHIPPARPTTEPTDIIFYIAKHQIMAVFEKIIRHAASTTTPSLAALAALSTELATAHAALPTLFHASSTTSSSPSSLSILDPPPLLVARLCVFSIHQKSLCVLHRRHVLARHAPSVRACAAAATALLARWTDVWDAFAPGGALAAERWFRSSVAWHDFLLACTALCLVLCCSGDEDRGTHDGGDRGGAVDGEGVVGGDVDREIDIPGSLATLGGARTVLASRRTGPGSRDTRRVERLVAATERYCARARGHSARRQAGEVEMEIGLGQGYDEIGLWGDAQPPQQQQQRAMTATTSTTMTTPTTTTTRSSSLHELSEARDPTWEYLKQFLNLPEGDEDVDEVFMNSNDSFYHDNDNSVGL
nr:putative transcriptional regulatory protein [Quercus suber]